MKMRFIPALFFLLSTTQYSLGQSAALQSFVAAYTQAHNFSGTVLIQKDSGVQYHNSFGWANHSFRVPNKTDTKYKIASITKLFTAVLILQVYDQGKLDLHKPIKSYLPHFAGEAAGKVTIHQLLNHTSGLANMDTITSLESALKNGIPAYQKPATPDELFATYCRGKLAAEPGKVFSYNNADYIALGKIIEQVTGKAFGQVLRENILQPLQMNASGLLHQYDIIEGLADTYFFRNDLNRLVKDLPLYIENFYAAAAMYATTSDLLKFSNALFGGRLLKKETLALLTKPGLDDYGYGVWIAEWSFNDKNYVTVQRPGSIMGAQCKLVYIKNAGVTIIILGNTDTASVDDFAYELGKRMVE